MEKKRESAEWIKENYPKFRAYSDLYAKALYEVVLKDRVPDKLLQEFVKTVSSDKTIEIFEKQFGQGASIEVHKIPTGGEELEVRLEVFSQKIQKELEHFFDSYGWYPAGIFDKNNRFYNYSEDVVKYFQNRKNIKIAFEPKYNQEVVPTTTTLYHATPDYSLDKIQFEGLSPKTKSKLSTHPGRIYLLEGFTEEYTSQDLARTLHRTDRRRSLIEEMVILEVDVKKLTNHTFYRDPNFFLASAVWTYDNIPPSAIRVVERVKYLKTEDL